MTTNTDLHVAMPELPKPIYCAKLARQCTDGCKPEPGRLGDPCWRVDWRDLGNVPATYQVRAEIQQATVPEGLQQAVLTLNAAWNRKEPEEAIAGHMDLCRRLALAAVPPKQQPALGRGEGGGVPLTTLAELGKRYSLDFASPHHMTFSVEGLRHLIEAVATAGQGMEGEE